MSDPYRLMEMLKPAYPPFSGNDGKCRKCGGNFIATAYRKEEDLMSRRCSTCGYSWHEKPLDGSQ